MTAKVDTALQRLIGILPLKEKQEACGVAIKELHRNVLRAFVEKGRILTKNEIAKLVSDPETAVKILRENDMVVFSADGEPVGAYPFTMEPREHRVSINGHCVHAMCALDALGVSPMFNLKTTVSSRCRITGAPVFIEQTGETITNIEQTGDVRFGIAWKAASTCACCADNLCTEMMFLKDGQVAQKWLTDDPEDREVFTLQEAVEFGARFFVPLMS